MPKFPSNGINQFFRVARNRDRSFLPTPKGLSGIAHAHALRAQAVVCGVFLGCIFTAKTRYLSKKIGFLLFVTALVLQVTRISNLFGLRRLRGWLGHGERPFIGKLRRKRRSCLDSDVKDLGVQFCGPFRPRRHGGRRNAVSVTNRAVQVPGIHHSPQRVGTDSGICDKETPLAMKVRMAKAVTSPEHHSTGKHKAEYLVCSFHIVLGC